MNIAIVGAGVMGRLLALELRLRDHQIHLFDYAGPHGEQTCSWVAAGLICPVGESENSQAIVSRLGADSLGLWQEILSRFQKPVYFNDRGGLAVSHAGDSSELNQLAKHLEHASMELRAQNLDRQGIEEKEPELAERFSRALYFPCEGCLDPREFLESSSQHLAALGVECFWETYVQTLSEQGVQTAGRSYPFDKVIDCRGLEAKDQAPDLRGVRGEMFIVHAPQVFLKRPIHFKHPRQPIYVVPRRNQHYVLGATAIESEDFSSVSVRSTLEILSSAYAVHTGFAEARVVESLVHCRPAFSDNLPAVRQRKGVLQVNGLYRNGYLLGPKMAELVSDFVESKVLGAQYEPLFQGAIHAD